MTETKHPTSYISKCECCKRDGVEILGVASSSLGPMSLAFCRECLENRAEPKWMLEFVRDEDNWRIHLEGFWEAYTFYEDGTYHPAVEIRDAKGA